MKILLTGYNGFVGRNIRAALAKDGHDVRGIEAEPHFKDWHGKFYKSKRFDFMLKDIDAVVHAGAIATNQFADPSIFLWNSYGSLVLAKYVRDRYGQIPFFFFSTFQVTATEADWNQRSWYGWSKAFAEECIREVTPHATIVRPGVMWGDEKHKSNPNDKSVPYQLATHQLKRLFRNWGRDYVHVNDVVDAVRIGIQDAPQGTFNLRGEYWNNEQLSTLTDWNGYEWVGNAAEELGIQFTAPVLEDHGDGLPSLPGWTPKSDLKTKFKQIETEHDSK